MFSNDEKSNMLCFHCRGHDHSYDLCYVQHSIIVGRKMHIIGHEEVSPCPSSCFWFTEEWCITVPWTWSLLPLVMLHSLKPGLFFHCCFYCFGLLHCNCAEYCEHGTITCYCIEQDGSHLLLHVLFCVTFSNGDMYLNDITCCFWPSFRGICD